jgi:predicted MFS family arabinose efflux permease
MASRISIQTTLVGVGFTAMGVIGGFVVKEHGDKRLLLALPVVALVVNLLWSIESRRQSLSGTYIEMLLWPKLQTLAGGGLPSWEEDIESRRRWPYFLASLITDGVLLGLFVGAAVIGLVEAGKKPSPPDTLLAGGWVCVAISILFPAGLALATQCGRGTKRRKLEDAKNKQMVASISGGS